MSHQRFLLAAIVLSTLVYSLPVTYQQPSLIQSSKNLAQKGISTLTLVLGTPSSFTIVFTQQLTSSSYEVGIVNSGAFTQIKFCNFSAIIVSRLATQLTISLLATYSVSSPSIFLVGTIAVDQSLAASIIIMNGIVSITGSSNIANNSAAVITLPRASSAPLANCVAMIQSFTTSLSHSVLGVQATMTSSTSVTLQYTRWTYVTSLTVTLIVSTDSITPSCFFELAFINASTTSYSLPSQNLSERSIALIGLVQYYPSFDYNWFCSLDSPYCTPLYGGGTGLNVLFFTNMTCPANSTFGVLTVNTGVCSCDAGFYESGNACLPNPVTPPPAPAPPLPVQIRNQTTGYFVPEFLTITICNIVSIPDLSLLIRAREILTFIDDFTYFSYHKHLHSLRFRYFCDYMANITKIKWIPQFVKTSYSTIMQAFNTAVGSGSVRRVPQQWQQLDDSVSFLHNTAGFWIGQLPLSILVFVTLHYIEKLLRHRRWISRLLRSFRWAVSLWTLFLDNLQNFSFRIFQQLRDVAPTAKSQAIGGYINLTVAYTTLCLLLLLAFIYYVYLLRWLRANINVFWELTTPSKNAFLYVSVIFSIKIVSGATHALFCEEPVLQLSILLAIQVIILAATLLIHRNFVSKLTLTLFLQEYILRVALYTLLLLQITVECHDSKTVSCMESIMINLVFAIAVTSLLQIVSPYAIEINILSCSRLRKKKRIIPCKIKGTRQNQRNRNNSQSEKLRQLKPSSGITKPKNRTARSYPQRRDPVPTPKSNFSKQHALKISYRPPIQTLYTDQ